MNNEKYNTDNDGFNLKAAITITTLWWLFFLSLEASLSLIDFK